MICGDICKVGDLRSDLFLTLRCPPPLADSSNFCVRWNANSYPKAWFIIKFHLIIICEFTLCNSSLSSCLQD